MVWPKERGKLISFCYIIILVCLSFSLPYFSSMPDLKWGWERSGLGESYTLQVTFSSGHEKYIPTQYPSTSFTFFFFCLVLLLIDNCFLVVLCLIFIYRNSTQKERGAKRPPWKERRSPFLVSHVEVCKTPLPSHSHLAHSSHPFLGFFSPSHCTYISAIAS